MPHLPIKKTRNYFISTAGYVFKIENGKEVKCKVTKTPNTKEIRIFIEKKQCSLLYLMIEYFIGDLKPSDIVRFTANKDLEIPLTSIRITKATGGNLSPEEEAQMFKFKCDFKARSANMRCDDKITTAAVYKVLAISGFKCVYCSDTLHPNSWHLDHFTSISRGGKNMLENLVASCGTCNIMKGALDGRQFYKKCKQIVENYLFKKESESGCHLTNMIQL